MLLSPNSSLTFSQVYDLRILGLLALPHKIRSFDASFVCMRSNRRGSACTALSPGILPARAPARGALSAAQRGFVRGAKRICLQRKKVPFAAQKEIAILTIIFLTYEHTFI